MFPVTAPQAVALSNEFCLRSFMRDSACLRSKTSELREQRAPLIEELAKIGRGNRIELNSILDQDVK